MTKNYKTLVLDPKYTPKKNEEYMSLEQRAYFYQTLTAQREGLLSEMDELLNEIYVAEKNQMGQGGDEADKSSLVQEVENKRKTHNRNKNLLVQIDAALQRLENNTYGYSVISGDEIGLKRLMARPLATMTIEEREEHESKRI